jgi:hypothetical protein
LAPVAKNASAKINAWFMFSPTRRLTAAVQGHQNPVYARRALEAGASAFVVKRCGA